MFPPTGTPVVALALVAVGLVLHRKRRARAAAHAARAATPAPERQAAEDARYLALARARLAALAPPAHSKFRVGCIIVYARGGDDAAPRTVFGTNIETQNIAGSLCAERGALAALRARALSASFYFHVLCAADCLSARRPLAGGWGRGLCCCG